MKAKGVKYIAVIIFAIVLVVGGIYSYNYFIKNQDNVNDVDIEDVDVAEDKKATPPKKQNKPSLDIDINPSDYSDALEDYLSDQESSFLSDSLGKEELDETQTIDQFAEQKPIHIPYTKSLFNIQSVSTDNMLTGKVYYQESNGRIESVVSQKENNQWIESLVSYDCMGNKIDELEIGVVDESNNKKKYAVISQNKVSTFSKYSDDKGKETVIEYSITPNLKFVKGKTYTKIL